MSNSSSAGTGSSVLVQLLNHVGKKIPPSMVLDNRSVISSNESVPYAILTSPPVVGGWMSTPALTGHSAGRTSTRDLRFGGLTWVSQDAGGESPHLVTILLVTLGVVVLVIVLVCVVLYLLKRSKLDKIRHHLMPLYNFDPTDEEPHWEQDLMEDDREQQIALNTVDPATRPKLKFHGGQDA